jgi:broad specificity phosphatase PhoE
VTTLAAAATAKAQTTIYLVRHAEKAGTVADRDPPLSETGRQRAAILAKMLRSAKLEAAYATDFDRTKQTVEPAAQGAGLTVTTYASERELAEKLKAGTAGKSVLVAGHSNTVPAMLEALGVAEKVTLGERDYDNLFIVVIGRDGGVSFQRLHYGVELAP